MFNPGSVLIEETTLIQEIVVKFSTPRKHSNSILSYENWKIKYDNKVSFQIQFVKIIEFAKSSIENQDKNTDLHLQVLFDFKYELW